MTDGWNRVTADHASAGGDGWQTHRPDGGRALLLMRAYILDATFEDAIVTLPDANENAGRLVWCKRIDAAGTLYDAIVYPASTFDTIQGAASYSLASQYSSVVLCATEANEWLVVSEIT